ncbi:TMEM165/GDT1 family protein [Nocardia wallacei]|uniref:TMEM165/GDT1 family protein n=1 Tax=Nocardia wallacei TaxID=480035 RepID=UPI002457CDA6|nr:TMEM165/GDT1 family protein [Nocardia wallacei]
MITTIALSFGVIFVAELGDKSQLMALTFALRYRWWIVLSGIAAASVAVNLIATGVGHFLGAALPTELITVCTGVILLAVGGWTLREVHARGADPETTAADSAARPPGRAFFVVLSAFLLAELGDRTMFATIALASNRSWVAVWTGSVLGMVAAGALAIAIGITVGRHLPERLIATGSGLLFLYIGTATLLGALAPTLGQLPELALAAITPALAGGALWVLRRTEPARHPRLSELGR